MMNTLKELLHDEIRDLFDAENRILKALPQMANKASSSELRVALHDHVDETTRQVDRLTEVSALLGINPIGETCEATKGLIAEAEDTVGKIEDPEVRDAAIIAQAQRVEHYEISSYGSAIALAKTLDLDKVASILGDTLDEEKEADGKLTKIAKGGILSAGVNTIAAEHG